MHRLVCNVQKYGWGRPGSESSVARYQQAMDPTFKIDPTQPYAELWMGTHVNCPSSIQLDDSDKSKSVPLKEYIGSNANITLGEKVIAHFAEKDTEIDLPFLFKVLSINKALSIQAHPNKNLAKELHANDPAHYPDANHKPEMLIAISERFEAMCGFRPAQEIAAHFANEKYSMALTALCGPENVTNFTKSLDEDSLKACFHQLMSQPQSIVDETFSAQKAKLEEIKKKTEKNSSSLDLDSLFLRLAGQYPNDVGTFAIFLLNVLELKRGECIFLGANIPHAYLFGDGVECMARSDNVVRAGLTPKFKDVQVLCSMLDYRMRSIQANKLSPDSKVSSSSLSYLQEFRPPFDSGVHEFSVQEIHVRKKDLKAKSDFLIPKNESGSILIVIELNDKSDNNDSYFSLLNTTNNDSTRTGQLSARQGQVFWVDANRDAYFWTGSANNKNSDDNDDESTVLLAYRAYVDIKTPLKE